MALAALLHRTIPFWTVVVGSACLASACTKFLVLRYTESRAEQWKLVVGWAIEGPNRYRVGTAYIEPEPGARFLSFEVDLTNEASTSRGFNYDGCDLDAGDERILPSIVRINVSKGMEAPEFELLTPGQHVTRTLVFAYPGEHWPKRLRCGELLIPLEPEPVVSRQPS